MSDENLTEQLAFEAWLIKDHTDGARKRGMMETKAEVKLIESVNNFLLKKFKNGEYRDEEIQENWRGWQAGVEYARENLNSQLPPDLLTKVLRIIHTHLDGRCGFLDIKVVESEIKSLAKE